MSPIGAKLLSMLRLTSTAAVIIALGGCVAEQPVDLVVRGTIAVSGERSVTVLVSAGSCPTVQDTVRGAVSGVVYDESAALGTDLPPVGALEDRRYAFTALFRDPSCLPTRFGCVEQNPLDGTVDVVVELVEPFAGAMCPPDTFCDAGMCASGVAPPSGTCSGEGSSCATEDGPSGVCCRGVCRDDPAGSCAPSTCGDTSSDPLHCGECDRGCPAELGCAGGLCRALPPPTEIRVEVDPDIANEIRTNNGLLALLWQAPSIPGLGDGGYLAVTHSRPIGDDTAGGEPTYVRIPELAELAADDVWYDTPLLGDRIALATIVVASDTSANGILELDEVRGTDGSAVGVWVAQDIVLVASERDIERGGVLSPYFPEGIAGGVLPYRGSAADGGGGLTPTANTFTRLMRCDGDSGCIAIRIN